MKVAGCCFFMIAIFFLLELNMISEYQNEIESAFSSFDSSRLDFKARIDQVKTMISVQLVLLFIASIALLLDDGMSSGVKLRFEEIENAYQKLAEKSNLELSKDGDEVNSNSEINKALGI